MPFKYDNTSYTISEELFSRVSEFIDLHFVDADYDSKIKPNISHKVQMAESIAAVEICYEESVKECAFAPVPEMPLADKKVAERSLDDVLSRLEETFSQSLLRMIDEKGFKDSDVYKKANIDRRVFSKIRANKNYKPSKNTALAFAIALELSLDDTKDFLMKAGFALSKSNKLDVIVEYFITNRNYNVFEVNGALFAFEQSLLGA